MDFFVIPTIGFDLLYAFVVMRIDRRELLWIHVTKLRLRNGLRARSRKRFLGTGLLLHDPETAIAFTATSSLVDYVSMGIRDNPTAPASPWQNGFAERLIGSIRREACIVVFSARPICAEFCDPTRYYNDIRTYRSLDKDAPVSARFSGSIKSFQILGGLHPNHYVRVRFFGTPGHDPFGKIESSMLPVE